MSDRLSRREFAKRAAIGAAVAALPTLGLAQQTPPTAGANDAALDAAVTDLEKMLAEPLTSKVKKITRESVRSNRRSAEARMRFSLPENSEPCTVYFPTAHQSKGAQ